MSNMAQLCAPYCVCLVVAVIMFFLRGRNFWVIWGVGLFADIIAAIFYGVKSDWSQMVLALFVPIFLAIGVILAGRGFNKLVANMLCVELAVLPLPWSICCILITGLFVLAYALRYSYTIKSDMSTIFNSGSAFGAVSSIVDTKAPDGSKSLPKSTQLVLVALPILLTFVASLLFSK